MKALRNADAAGDTAAATRLAQMAREARTAATEPQPRGIGQRLYDNIIGDPTDGVHSYGEQLGTWLNRAGESATLGVVGDEASAAAYAPIKRALGNERSYADELTRFRQNEANMSTAARLSADLAGALVPGAGMAGNVARAGTWGARALRGAGAGAAAGGLLGYMEGEGDASDRMSDALSGGLLGGGVGGAIPSIGAAVRSAASGHAGRVAVKNAARNAPSSDELRDAGNALYRQIDDSGVQIKPQAFDNMRAGLLDRLRSTTGYDELPGPGSLTPNTARVMNIMDEAGAKMAQEPSAALPFRSLDQMRRQAGAAAGNVANKGDQKAGMTVIEGLDDFVRNLGDSDVVAGDLAALKTAIPKAREIWSRMSKSQLIDDAMERSENYLSGSASGVRNQFKNILQNKKLSSQFTRAERAALRQVTHGNALEQLINLAGGGLAQMGSIGGGLAAGGPVGGLLGAAAAAGQRKLSEAVTMRNAEMARAAIASGRLRDPGLLNQLAIAGQRPERLTNTGLFGLLTASSGQ